MSEQVTYKRIWQVAFPIIISGLADNIYNVINTIFVGQLSKTAGEFTIGAVGLGGMFYYNWVILIIGLAMGAQIVIGRRNGEKEYEEAGKTFTGSFFLFGLIGVFMIGLLYLIAPPLLRMLITSNRVYDVTVGFVNIRIWGFVFVGLFISMRVFLIGITKTKYILFITFFSVGVNVLLDYLLIFGNWGFPKLGVNGAAYSSIIAEACSFVAYLICCTTLVDLKKYRLFNLSHIRVQPLFQVLKTGFPLMLQYWLSFGCWLLFFIFIEKMGERELAVSSVTRSLYMFYFIPILGFGSTAGTLTSNLMGEGRQSEIMKMAYKVIILSLGVMLILSLANMLFPAELISIFNDKPELISSAVGPLRVISVTLLFLPFTMILFHVVSGVGATKVNLLIEIGTLSCYMIYIYLLTRVFVVSITLVWTAEMVYMIIAGSACFLYLRYGKWKHLKV